MIHFHFQNSNDELRYWIGITRRTASYRERLANWFLNNYIGKYLEIPDADLLSISLRKILLLISPFFLPRKRMSQNPNFMATKKSKAATIYDEDG
jgi:hypothetical protein